MCWCTYSKNAFRHLVYLQTLDFEIYVLYLQIHLQDITLRGSCIIGPTWSQAAGPAGAGLQLGLGIVCACHERRSQLGLRRETAKKARQSAHTPDIAVSHTVASRRRVDRRLITMEYFLLGRIWISHWSAALAWTTGWWLLRLVPVGISLFEIGALTIYFWLGVHL